MFVDPLAEKYPSWTPYHYVHNNPINMVDPTGMSAEGLGDPPDEEATELPEILIIVNRADVTPKDQSLNLNQGSTYSNKLSSDFSKAYVNSGLKHGVDWFKDNVLIHGYNFWNNNSVVTGYGSGEYGPYTGDAIGISLSLGAWGSSFGVSFVLDNYNNFETFYSYSGGAGYTGIGLSFGATLDSYNNNDPENRVLDGIAGPTYDLSGGLFIMGTYSKPIDPTSRQVINNGVERYSFGLGTGIRAGEGRTYSSGQIRDMISNYFKSIKR